MATKIVHKINEKTETIALPINHLSQADRELLVNWMQQASSSERAGRIVDLIIANGRDSQALQETIKRLRERVQEIQECYTPVEISEAQRARITDLTERLYELGRANERNIEINTELNERIKKLYSDTGNGFREQDTQIRVLKSQLSGLQEVIEGAEIAMHEKDEEIAELRQVLEYQSRPVIDITEKHRDELVTLAHLIIDELELPF